MQWHIYNPPPSPSLQSPRRYRNVLLSLTNERRSHLKHGHSLKKINFQRRMFDVPRFWLSILALSLTTLQRLMTQSIKVNSSKCLIFRREEISKDHVFLQSAVTKCIFLSVYYYSYRQLAGHPSHLELLFCKAETQHLCQPF